MVQSLPQSDGFRILFNSPELAEVQRSGFHLFLKNGIAEELSKISCIQLKYVNFCLEIVIDAPHFRLVTPENNYRDCILKMKSYTCKLYVQIKILFKDKRSGELLYQTQPEWVLLADLPIMTKRGHFVINGSPRVIVHQVGRAPGVYFKKVLKIKKDVNNKARFYGDIIPRKGVWLRLQINKKGEIDLKLKKSKKVRAEMVQKCLELLEKEESNIFAQTNKSFLHNENELSILHTRAAFQSITKQAFYGFDSCLRSNHIKSVPQVPYRSNFGFAKRSVFTQGQSFFSPQSSFLTGISMDDCFSSKSRQTQAFVTGFTTNKPKTTLNPLWYSVTKSSLNFTKFTSNKIDRSLLKQVTETNLDQILKQREWNKATVIHKASYRNSIPALSKLYSGTDLALTERSTLPLGAKLYGKERAALTKAEKEAFADVYTSFYKSDIQDIEERVSMPLVKPSSVKTKSSLTHLAKQEFLDSKASSGTQSSTEWVKELDKQKVISTVVEDSTLYTPTKSKVSKSKISKRKKLAKRQNVSSNLEKVREYLYQLFKRSDLYDLSPVGREKINTKFGISVTKTQLTALDIKETINWLSKLRAGKEEIDDIDHSQNRRVRTSSELIQSQFEVGITRLKNIVTKKVRNRKIEQIKALSPVYQNKGLLDKLTLLNSRCLPKAWVFLSKQSKQGFGTKTLTPEARHFEQKSIKLVYFDRLHFRGRSSRFVKHNKIVDKYKYNPAETQFREGALPEPRSSQQNKITFTCINPYWMTYKEKKKYYSNLSELKFTYQKPHLRRNLFNVSKYSSTAIPQTANNILFRRGMVSFMGKKGLLLPLYSWGNRLNKRDSCQNKVLVERATHYEKSLLFQKQFLVLQKPRFCTSKLSCKNKAFVSGKTKSILVYKTDISVQKLIIEKKTFAQQDTLHPYQSHPFSNFSVSELFSTKPINGALREFFSSSPLSQYMDQTNPLAEITHKRRISSLGVGGVSRESAGMAIRGIHPTHYGRICPIETPEGKNAGLVNSLSFYAKINNQGFIETPYYQVMKGQIQHELGFSFYSAGQESKNGLYIAPNDIKQSKSKLLASNISTSESIPVRVADNLLDLFKKVSPYQVDCIGISPVQILSVATSLIPFLEHNDANRALMGSNMQRQAVSLMISERPLVGTGLEARVLAESGHLVQAKVSGFVSSVSAHKVVIERLLHHFDASCQNTVPVTGTNSFTKTKLERYGTYGRVPLFVGQNGSQGYRFNKNKAFTGYKTLNNFFVSQIPYRACEQKAKLFVSTVQRQTNTSIVFPNTYGSGSFTKEKSEFLPVVHSISTFSRSNQETCLIQKPLVEEGDWLQRGDMVSDCSAGHKGELSVGKNMLIAYIPWQGYNFEDAIVISDRLVKEQLYTSLHIERYTVIVNDFKDKVVDTNEWFTGDLPGVDSTKVTHLQRSGLPVIGTILKEGDILVGKIRYSKKKPATPHEKLVCDILGEHNFSVQNSSLYVPKGVHEARVLTYKIKKRFEKALKNNLRPLGAPKIVHIFLGEKRNIQVGDKMSGRHGNKGIVSTILPKQDMPYLADGSPIDIILNPLGVPSRMNVGQVFECLLGLASTYLHQNFKVTAFDELYGVEASQSLVFLKLYQARLQSGQNWLFQVSFPGKTRLTDGRSGECLDQWITVGRAYMLKLIHMVNEKIHARAIGPYALVTQQPLKGRAHKGGQRLGEMEVWAIEGFGAAYILQELLTKKSDDSIGRKDVLKAMLPKSASFLDSFDPFNQSTQTESRFALDSVSTYSKKESQLHSESENFTVLGQPDIFKVLICELQALCLDVGVYSMKTESFQRQFLGVI